MNVLNNKVLTSLYAMESSLILAQYLGLDLCENFQNKCLFESSFGKVLSFDLLTMTTSSKEC